MSASGPISDIILLDVASPRPTRVLPVDPLDVGLVEPHGVSEVLETSSSATQKRPRASPGPRLDEVELVGEKDRVEAPTSRPKRRVRLQNEPEMIEPTSFTRRAAGPVDGDEPEIVSCRLVDNEPHRRRRRNDSIEIVAVQTATPARRRGDSGSRNGVPSEEESPGQCTDAHHQPSADEEYARELMEAEMNGLTNRASPRRPRSRTGIHRPAYNRRRTPQRSAFRRRNTGPVASAPWMNPGPTSLFQTLEDALHQRSPGRSLLGHSSVFESLLGRIAMASPTANSSSPAGQEGPGMSMDYESLLRLDENISNRGLDKNVMDSLPVTAATEANAEETCCVCLCEYEVGEKMTRLPCFHTFHSTCIEKWLSSNGTCPIDKIAVSSGGAAPAN